MLTGTARQTYVSEFALDVRSGLTKTGQKEIPSRYLYDEIGSALFEVITLLPEYGLSRADERLVRGSAEAISEIFLSEPIVVAELGSGSGKKTACLLEALAWRRTVYSPIEISRKALEQCSKELGRIPNVDIHAIQKPYLEGLAAVTKERLPGERILVLFLGSTIGNFERWEAERFLIQVRRMLSAGDALLLGTDLEKRGSQLVAAYDDLIGVTAAFNLNLLARMNRELDADFDIRQFRHLARYNAEERRVEMHLMSTRPQTVDIPRSHCRISFAENETIWTESSHKYRCDEVVRMGTSSGFCLSRQWTDLEWDFAETLLIAE